MIRPDNVPVAVDVIVRRPNGQFLLVRRRNEPYGWALPGGFLEAGESLAEAAAREVREETGLDIVLGQQFYAYSRPGRDPRGPVVSVVFVGAVWSNDEEPAGGDDAAEARFFDAASYSSKETPLAFDHATILTDYFTWSYNSERPPVNR